MSSETRIPLARAERLAAELVELLRPACLRIEVAGSIRRRKADVGDIELVAIPLVEQGHDMFGEPNCAYIDRLVILCSDLLNAGVLQQRVRTNGRAWGTRYKAAAYCGFPVDLFAVLPPAQFGVLFLLRTGPAEFSRRFVTSRRQGGMLPEWAQVKDGALWHRGGRMIETPEEADVWRTLGVDPIAPEARS